MRRYILSHCFCFVCQRVAAPGYLISSFKQSASFFPLLYAAPAILLYQSKMFPIQIDIPSNKIPAETRGKQTLRNSIHRRSSVRFTRLTAFSTLVYSLSS